MTEINVTNDIVPVDTDIDFDNLVASEDLSETEDETTPEETFEEFIIRTVTELAEDLKDTADNTPYALHVLVNAGFAAIEVDKEIRPQMMYNYDRNGLIAKGFKGVKRYTREQAIVFAIKYITKHAK